MIGSVDLSALFGATSASDAASSIASILSGNTAASGGDPLSALKTAERDETRDVAQTAKQPQVARAIAAFTQAVAKAKTPADLLKNPQALDVLLTANGLGDQAAYPALAQKALLSDTTDKKSLANQLADTRWKTVAQTYDFANKGLSVLQNPKVLATLANGYAEVTWRKSLDAATPGLSNALSFRAGAAKVTSVDQILGDSTLRTVVTGALGIPPQIAFQQLGAQEKAISDRLDIRKLQDPKFVEGLAQRYLLSAQGSGGGSGTDRGVAGQAGAQALVARKVGVGPVENRLVHAASATTPA